MSQENTQLTDVNGTRLTLEDRPNDVRFRLEAKNGHEVLFYATMEDVRRIIGFLNGQPDNAQQRG